MHIWTRTFSGGRRVPKTMLGDYRVLWNLYSATDVTDLTLPEPWIEGDIIKLTMSPWYHSPVDLPDNWEKHLIQREIDTYPLTGLADSWYHFWFEGTFEFKIHTDGESAFVDGIDFIRDTWQMRVDLNLENKQIFRSMVWSNITHDHADVGMYIKDVVIWR